ncbi:MAG: hypothetical protein IT440_12615 [Phycisphaeraceae bacterium]|nr:hypothetical protein [Phycisphaeraceae bacterium]
MSVSDPQLRSDIPHSRTVFNAPATHRAHSDVLHSRTILGAVFIPLHCRSRNRAPNSLEHVECFTVDSTGHAPDNLTCDAAGNLTYDGLYAYSYDAWNRLCVA